MTALNKQALREAAEKATAGQWVVELGDEVYAVDGDDSEQIAMVFSDNGRSDAAFIAAASPTTMLALLDELEAAEKRIAEHNFENRLLANADRDIKALRQRIAELEAGTVAVKQFGDFQIVHYGGSEDYAKGYIDCQNNYNKALAAAGIGVKGE
ncbi:MULTISPECIES: ead/Ea22-like family protein [Citrobacter]|uniref:ead/Ea22-like family protein n=1 Tax=Citrobacter TaxID=544 RepID=UPI0018666F9B|nr:MULTISPECIES: ead/Ea22-like family protein [Citrobacter]MDU5627979.1 ead/Ea22-like family protein [Citrobacter sp.]